MSFIEALAQAMLGRKIRKVGWKHVHLKVRRRNNGSHELINCIGEVETDTPFNPLIEDMLYAKWIVLDE